MNDGPNSSSMQSHPNAGMRWTLWMTESGSMKPKESGRFRAVEVQFSSGPPQPKPEPEPEPELNLVELVQ